MARFVKLSNGRLKGDTIATLKDPLYREIITVVSSPSGGNQIAATTAGTAITLPNSGSYSSDELQVNLDGELLQPVLDYTETSSTQVTFLFDLELDDVLEFIIERNL